jgi:hypothetical protein
MEALHEGIQIGAMGGIDHRNHAERLPEAQERRGQIVPPGTTQKPRITVNANPLEQADPLQQAHERSQDGFGRVGGAGFSHAPQRRAHVNGVKDFHGMRLLGRDERIDRDDSFAIQLQLE